MFTPFRAHYMLLHLPATPTHNKDGSIGPKLRDHKEQLYRAAKLLKKYGLSMSTFAACAADRRDGGFVELVLVGHTSQHASHDMTTCITSQYSLVEFNDVSERDSCWERRLLISRGKMKGGSATEASEPLLFDAAHLQPPSLGQQRIFRGKVSPADLPVGIHVAILQYTNAYELEVAHETECQ